jgi:hypothetical protein
MISPDEIKMQVLKWWKPFLQSYILGENFFPKSIGRIGKVKPGHITQRFEVLQQEIELLYRHSKKQTGFGYRVHTEDHTFRRTGNHELPDSVVFDTVEDYINFTSKKKQWKLFLSNLELIISAIPSLKDWASHNCLWLTDPLVNWTDILKVCQYFVTTPRPYVYIRQLPIDIHTKFIEENVTLIQSLLDFLIPGHIRSPDQKRFAERYFLRYDEPLIRIRILDPAQLYASKLSDVSIPLSDFEQIALPAENVLMAENKMNFLTLPSLPSTIAVWSGGGFNIGHLKNVAWLNAKKIFYWGDIDEHGFQLLHILRGYYPHAKSIMMDKKTFDQFREFAVDGPRNKFDRLALLTEHEDQLYRYLKSLDSKNRLEQEKLNQNYVDEYVKIFFKCNTVRC